MASDVRTGLVEVDVVVRILIESPNGGQARDTSADDGDLHDGLISKVREGR